MRSDYAVWSGYQIDQQSFRDLVSMLRDEGPQGNPTHHMPDVISAYLRWTRQLPRKMSAKAPNVRFRTRGTKEEIITHIFFPLRWVPYKTRRQITDPAHPDYAAVHEPTEKDKAKFENWLRVLNERLDGKYHIDKDKFEFSVMKDLHPSVEWRIY